METRIGASPRSKCELDSRRARDVDQPIVIPVIITTTTTMVMDHQLMEALALFAGAATVRVLVGFHPFSGQGNYHGSKVAYGGDFEAQRHWMEITWQLPISEWYWYDLEYWGLDYPPLTAYVSWVCGMISHWIAGPESVALTSSRGYEDHKWFMRATVLVSDLLIYGTAIWIWTKNRKDRYWLFALAMLHPAIVLIDHGHFQYNTTALGLSLWAFYYMTQSNWKSCITASIFFCLALNFKQMTLYYAPAVFFYLLGRCISKRDSSFFLNLAMLGSTVIVCFALLWWPVIAYGPDSTSYSDRLFHVLGRIFPFSRGLFEGKVANIWCAGSVRPLSLRKRIPTEFQPTAALFLTFCLMLPSCIRMLQIGLARQTRQRELLLWGMTSCSLAFFLASFQVHEKSLLMVLVPASLLLNENPVFVRWLTLFGTWTLWPLLSVDRLQTAYVCMIGISVGAGLMWNEKIELQALLACFLPVLLHFAELFISPPSSLPDLFPVLWSVVGCVGLGLSYIYTVVRLFAASKAKLQ